MSDSRFSILDTQYKNPESNRRKDAPLHPSSDSIGESQVGLECVEISLEELVEILDAELYQYGELIRLFQAQREAFTSSDVSSFEEISKQQGTVVLKIKTLEEARKSIASRLAQYFDVPAEGLTLGKLATLVDDQYSERCVEYQEEILSLIRELESLRENNAYLIQQALHYVSGVLRIFASSNAAEPAYSSGGQQELKMRKGKRISGWG